MPPLDDRVPTNTIVFWQPIASPHQEALLEAIADQFDGWVVLAVEKPLPPDRAILPSRFDGWGTLANEALAAGTPVICTDCCGCASIVAGGPANRVVPTGRVDRLAAALADAVAEGPLETPAREVVRRAAEAKSSAPLAAARFLVEVRRR